VPLLECPVAGPFFEQLALGQVFSEAPPVRLTDGMVAVHRSIVGGRTALGLDADLASEVMRTDGALAPPALVWDVAIGQSSLATHEVIANLYYQDLRFLRAPLVGDTMHTTTTVEDLRQNTPRPGRRTTGLAALHVQTVDHAGRPVLDFIRCAMLPLRDQDLQTDTDDDSGEHVAAEPMSQDYVQAVRGWDLKAFRAARPGRHFTDIEAGERFTVAAGDVVSSAPELARLTLNIAAVHHDSSRSNAGRLVYGGHTIGLALHQAWRCLPNLVTVLAWKHCDHLAPVHEGDLIRTTLEVEKLEPWGDGGLVHLRSRAVASSVSGDADVLDWRFVALMS
jgi:acyl dehydratase